MEEAQRLTIGMIKAVPIKWDLEANWRVFEELARRAATSGAQLICTPECFLDGYASAELLGFDEGRFREISQSLDGESYLSRARELAAELSVHLVFGFTELAADESGSYNSAALISDSGDIIGVYRKLHLLDHDDRFLPGDSLPVFDTPLARLGMMICADRRWPETARTLRCRGAQLIMNPTYGMHHLDNEWWMRTRSYENELFICFCHPKVALITAPDGSIDAKLEGDEPDVLVHDIDLTRCTDTMFSHRRPDVYDLG